MRLRLVVAVSLKRNTAVYNSKSEVSCGFQSFTAATTTAAAAAAATAAIATATVATASVTKPFVP